MRSFQWFSRRLSRLSPRRITAQAALFFFTAAQWSGAGAALTPPSAPEVSPQMRALQQLQAVSRTPPRVRFAQGFPRGVHAKVTVQGKDAVTRARNYLTQFRELYRQNNADLALGVRRVTGPPDEHVLFYQTYKGLEVYGGELLVMLSGNEVRSTIGGVLNGKIVLNTKPYLSQDKAEDLARKKLTRPQAPLTAETKLMVYDPSLFDDIKSEPHLAWRVIVGGGVPVRLFIDAHDGRMLSSVALIETHGSPLQGLDLSVWDDQGQVDSACWEWTDAPALIANETWFNSAYNVDQNAVQGTDHAKTAYAFFHKNFDWHSFDGQGSELEVHLHAGFYDSNAWWDPGCNSMFANTDHVSRDTFAHELTHGVINLTSHLVYERQPGALNESYADVMGTFADQDWEEAQGLPIDWLQGEDALHGKGPSRDLSNPTNPNVRFPQRDHMDTFISLDPNEEPNFEENDYGWVHYNSGIPDKAAHLMAAGGIHYYVPVSPMGRVKTGQLKFNALRHLPSNATFADAGDYEIAKAAEWAQSGTNFFTLANACSVYAAWAAVGVGLQAPAQNCANVYVPPDTDGDFIPDQWDNCDATPNPDQDNHDFDTLGDACDGDDDGDGLPDSIDQCPLGYNFGGENGPCDDVDDDGVKNDVDNCVGDPNADQQDSDGNGWGDACDYDGDGDGDGAGDNCPNVVNPDQTDSDGDLYGDACDFCPLVPHQNPAFTQQHCSDGFCFGGGNPVQSDSDGDGLGDECDYSFTIDGVPPMGGMTPDNKKHAIKIDVTRQSAVRIPITVCTRNCADGFKPTDAINFVLTGLDKNIKTRVVDEQGNSVKKAVITGDTQELQFSPRGGRQYFLSFAFGPHAPRGQAAFSLQMSAKRAPLKPRLLQAR